MSGLHVPVCVSLLQETCFPVLVFSWFHRTWDMKKKIEDELSLKESTTKMLKDSNSIAIRMVISSQACLLHCPNILQHLAKAYAHY